MTSSPNSNNDPYPWVLRDEDGTELHRVHPGRIDETDPAFSEWQHEPRTDDELEALGFPVSREPLSTVNNDPDPWVLLDDDGTELHRTHSGRIDETDPAFSEWQYLPRTDEELDALDALNSLD